MKRLAAIVTIILAAAFLVSPPVRAADKGGPAPAISAAPSVIHSPWSCYLQGLGGSTISTFAPSDSAVSVSAKGMTVTGGLGCDWRHDRVVLGLVGRYEHRLSGSDVLRMEDAWSAAFRGGYMVNPHVLAYGLIGGTKARFGFDDMHKSASGLLLGLGTEIALANNLALVAEYNYARLGRFNADDSITIDPATHAVRLGLSYRFHGSLFRVGE
jgi:opacity protein-like surface antigen